MSNCSGKYIGKFRCIVINNVDPLVIARLQVIVPDVEAFRKASMVAIVRLEDKWGKGLYEKIAAVR